MRLKRKTQCDENAETQRLKRTKQNAERKTQTQTRNAETQGKTQKRNSIFGPRKAIKSTILAEDIEQAGDGPMGFLLVSD